MKTTKWRRSLTLLLPFLLAGLFASIVCADQGDPPGRVARLSMIQGKVTFQPSGETDWSEASLNRPVTTGDRIYADKGARAELEAYVDLNPRENNATVKAWLERLSKPVITANSVAAVSK